MPTINRDASELTRKRRAMALYAFNSVNSAAVNAGTSMRREQVNTQTLDIVTARKQGGCYCAEALAGTYPLVGCGACRGGA
jgi:hypothetical protein